MLNISQYSSQCEYYTLEINLDILFVNNIALRLILSLEEKSETMYCQ